MQNVEDKATFGGVTTGPLEDGLTVVAVSGDAKTAMGTLVRNEQPNKYDESQRDTDVAIEDEAHFFKKGGVNPDQSMSPSAHEVPLWKTLWETRRGITLIGQRDSSYLLQETSLWKHEKGETLGGPPAG